LLFKRANRLLAIDHSYEYVGEFVDYNLISIILFSHVRKIYVNEYTIKIGTFIV